jgi:Zn-dependent protease with chaperone function
MDGGRGMSPDREAAGGPGSVSRALRVLVLTVFAALALQAALGVIPMAVWTTLVVIAVVAEVAYLGFRPPPSPAPIPVSVARLRSLLVAVSLAAVGVAWLLPAAAAARAWMTGGSDPARFVAVAGLLVAGLVAATTPYAQVTIRKSYRAPEEGDPAYVELRSRIAHWSGRLHLAVAPSLVVSRVQSELPHLMGAAGRTYFAVPANYPEIERVVKRTWPALADDLLDFTVAHELTHAAHEDCARLTWARALFSLLARWLVPGVLALAVGSILLGAAAPTASLVTVAVAGWTTAMMLIAVFAQMLVIIRDREVLADQWAAELLGPEWLARLREAPRAGGAESAGHGSVLEAYLGFYGAYEGPMLGQPLTIGVPGAAADDTRSLLRRLGDAVAGIVDRFASALPRPAVRLRAIDVAHDPAALFRAREHGLMSGLTLAALQAVLVIDGALVGYRDFLRLEWIWLWACVGVLVFLVFQPVRCMEIRPLSPERVTSAVTKSHTWSVVVAAAAVLLLALPAMVAHGEQAREAVSILLFLVAAHIAAAYLGATFISCSCPETPPA